MINSFEAFVLILQMQLTAAEKAGSVAYAVETPVAAGTQLRFPGTVIDVPAEAYVAFIDRQPTANWGRATSWSAAIAARSARSRPGCRRPHPGPEL